MAMVIQDTVVVNGTGTNLCRITGWENAAITQADIASIEYTIYRVTPGNPPVWTVIAGHENVAVAVADAVIDTLQNDSRWTKDATGYNFRHTIPISSDPAFTVPDGTYRVQYTLTPTTGQKFPAPFSLRAV